MPFSKGANQHGKGPVPVDKVLAAAAPDHQPRDWAPRCQTVCNIAIGLQGRRVFCTKALSKMNLGSTSIVTCWTTASERPSSANVAWVKPWGWGATGAAF